jgi:hypothetical protein
MKKNQSGNAATRRRKRGNDTLGPQNENQSIPDFRILFESAPGLFMVLAPDSPRFTILAASDAYLRATKKQREEIVGRAVFDVFPRNSNGPSEASFQRVLQRRIPDQQALPQNTIDGSESRLWSVLKMKASLPKI